MTETTFGSFGLPEAIVAAIEKKGYVKPTQIQEEAIPIILSGEKDLFAQSQTGTGKTAAFGLPILSQLNYDEDGIQALVLTPTRELAVQVSDELSSLTGSSNLKITPIYGGQSIGLQAKQLKRKNHIIVGTPGRVMDHMQSGRLNFSSLRFVVLDEADEMLNSGFFEDIEWILSKTPKTRRTFLFSATLAPQISSLIETYLPNCERIKVKTDTLATKLTKQTYYEVRESDKVEALCRAMDMVDDFYGLVFCKTKRDVDTITQKLVNRGYNAEAMHGDFNQNQREMVLKKFKSKRCKILVVTDVASRGLDITGLSHVINFAIPQDGETYVHRIGRTGRAGQSGNAITFITPSEFGKWKYIQRVAKTTIEKCSVPNVENVLERKKSQVSLSINESISSDNEETFKSLASELLGKHDAEDIIASLLQRSFKKILSEDSYDKISDVKPFNHKPRRDFREQRGQRGRQGRKDFRGGFRRKK